MELWQATASCYRSLGGWNTEDQQEVQGWSGKGRLEDSASPQKYCSWSPGCWWHMTSIYLVYISVNLRYYTTTPWSMKLASFVLMSCHMSQMDLWHAWSDASSQLQDCLDCLQALNLNCIYESNIPVLIWFFPDIFHKNDLSSVPSAWMISSLWKLVYTKVHNLGKRYMHWNQQKDSFCHEGIYLEYTWDISFPDIW